MNFLGLVYDDFIIRIDSYLWSNEEFFTELNSRKYLKLKRAHESIPTALGPIFLTKTYGA